MVTLTRCPRWPLRTLVPCALLVTAQRSAVADPGDFDDNGVVNAADYLAFYNCLTAPGTPAKPEECAAGDFNHDTDSDLADFARIQRIFGTCSPQWIDDPFPYPDVIGVVWATTLWDDGGGPKLYAGGDFVFPSSGKWAAYYVAKWDGVSWTALGFGVDAPVTALAVFDDGTGDALYAGGAFRTADGSAANRIAKWNGTSWLPLGAGFNDHVFDLIVFDDGSGPALFAGGNFTTADEVPVDLIAKWDGASWSALGSGLNRSGIDYPYVGPLAVFDDGKGPALYAGGLFNSAQGDSRQYIAKWDGLTWSPLGIGLNGPVYSMKPFAEATSTPVLYVGGAFTTAGSFAANRIAKWDGSAWLPLGAGVGGGIVRALMGFDDGVGHALYVGGSFTFAGGLPANRIAKWDGYSWSALEMGLSPYVSSLSIFDVGTGPALFAGGGTRSQASPEYMGYMAKWHRPRAPCP